MKGKTTKFILGIFFALTLALSLVVPALAAVTAVTINIPTTGAPAYVAPGGNVNVTYTITDDGLPGGFPANMNVRIQIYKGATVVGDSGILVRVHNGPAGPQVFVDTVSILVGAAQQSYDVIVTATNQAGGGPINSPVQANAVVVDNIAPTVTVNIPAFINSANAAAVPLTIDSNESGTYAYTISDGNPANDVTGTAAISAGVQVALTPNCSGLTDGAITADASVVDAAANTGNAPQDTATKDATAPTVTSITPAPALITDANVGAGNFTVVVLFSEAMNTGVAPTIAFTPAVASTLTFASGAWSVGNTTYTATYNVADANVTVYDVDIGVSAATDAAGNTQVAGNAPDALDIDTAKYAVALAVDWNLMSLPLIPDDTAIATVLAGIITDVEIVWYYDAEAPGWLRYAPGAPGNTLATMEDGKAYWIDMDAAATLLVDGIELPVAPNLPPAYDVKNGWNMVGFKSTANMAANVYLNAMDGKYTRIYGYNAGTGAFFAISSPFTGNMVPGLGYWVSFTDDGTIYP